MHLSQLLVDVGTDPDRPRPGRLWLRNVYRVHQRLCMAFPSASRKADDVNFLRPFRPEDFSQQVNVPRGVGAGFLFRIDASSPGRAMILVQSAAKPDWHYAFHNAGHLLAAPPQVKRLDLTFADRQYLRFRLRANPTKKLSRGHSGRKNGVRVGLYTEDEQRAWLDRKGVEAGFGVVSCDVVPEGKARASKSADGAQVRMPLLSVRFDGVLEVTDPQALVNTLRGGIGSAKAFGFGLLSVAPTT